MRASNFLIINFIIFSSVLLLDELSYFGLFSVHFWPQSRLWDVAWLLGLHVSKFLCPQHGLDASPLRIFIQAQFYTKIK